MLKKLVIGFLCIVVFLSIIFFARIVRSGEPNYPGLNNVVDVSMYTGHVGNAVVLKTYQPNEYLLISVAHLCHAKNLVSHLHDFFEAYGPEKTEEYIKLFLKNIIQTGQYCKPNIRILNLCSGVPMKMTPVYINFLTDIAIFKTTIPPLCPIDKISVDLSDPLLPETKVYLPFSLTPGYNAKKILIFSEIGLKTDDSVQIGGNTGKGMSGCGVYNNRTKKLIGIYRGYYTNGFGYNMGIFSRLNFVMNVLKTIEDFKQKPICVDDSSKTSCNLVLGTTKALSIKFEKPSP